MPILFSSSASSPAPFTCDGCDQTAARRRKGAATERKLHSAFEVTQRKPPHTKTAKSTTRDAFMSFVRQGWPGLDTHRSPGQLLHSCRLPYRLCNRPTFSSLQSAFDGQFVATRLLVTTHPASFHARSAS